MTDDSFCIFTARSEMQKLLFLHYLLLFCEWNISGTAE